MKSTGLVTCPRGCGTLIEADRLACRECVNRLPPRRTQTRSSRAPATARPHRPTRVAAKGLIALRYYPPRKPRSPDGSWGRHWLPRGEQAKFREALLAAEGHRCWYCGVTDKPLQAHHETRTSGHMACQQCHNRLTQENQLNGNPPPLP